MRTVLTTLNAKYIHTSLAIRYLHAATAELAPDVQIREYNINQHVEDIAADLFRAKAEVIGFACYIWNITETLHVAGILKKVQPDLIIILGGPEVSYDPGTLLADNPQLDYIISGEGEAVFRDVLAMLKNKGELAGIAGLAYRQGGATVVNEARVQIADLDVIPWPYGDLDSVKDKIIYYECSRGCPFQCQYCLSSTFTGVRFFSLQRVKRDLQRLVEAGVKQVKFVDRTFNCNRDYALDIFCYLAAQNGPTNFHFEIAADLLDDETLDFLATVPSGKFQFEIGVQSTYQPTLELIRRNTNWDKLCHVVTRLTRVGNIHLHLDLIAGLPGESYRQFGQSFNDVFALRPGRLQLGFLKLLKGSGVRLRAQEFAYLFADFPPYEVLGNCKISYEELLNLRQIEDLLEKYANSHHFDAALNYLITNHVSSPFAFFEAFAAFWQAKGYHLTAHRLKELYRILAEYYDTNSLPDKAVFLELLKFDYLRQERSLQLPEVFLKYEVSDYQERFYNFLKNPANVVSYLPEYVTLSAREISKRVLIETFRYDVIQLLATPQMLAVETPTTLLLQYERRDPIYNQAGFVKIEI